MQITPAALHDPVLEAIQRIQALVRVASAHLLDDSLFDTEDVLTHIVIMGEKALMFLLAA